MIQLKPEPGSLHDHTVINVNLCEIELIITYLMKNKTKPKDKLIQPDSGSLPML